MNTLKQYLGREGAFLELAEEIASAVEGKPAELVQRVFALVLDHLPKETSRNAPPVALVEPEPPPPPPSSTTTPPAKRARPPERKGKPASRNMKASGRVVGLTVEWVEEHDRVTVDSYAATGLQRAVAQQRLETAARAGKIARGEGPGEYVSLAEAARRPRS